MSDHSLEYLITSVSLAFGRENAFGILSENVKEKKVCAIKMDE